MPTLPAPTTSNPNGLTFAQPHPVPGYTNYNGRGGFISRRRVKSYITNKKG